MKKNCIIPAALFFALIAIFSCGKSSSNTYSYSSPSGPTAPTGAATDSINLSNKRFVPAIDTVHVGVPIKWKNDDGFNHTVTTDDGTTISSGNITPGTVYTFTFTAAGTYPYHCIYHQSMGMVGTLIVKP